HYEIWDTKLSKKMKPTYVIQLCCYAEMLQTVQGMLPENITVALGSGEKEILRTNDYFYYYQSLKNSFIRDQNQFDSNNMPDPADSKQWCDWSNYAEQILMEKDHLLQVATITRSQIKKLNAFGIQTMAALANSTEVHIPNMNPVIFTRLKSQARIQIASRDKDVPLFEIISPDNGAKAGLALLPPQSPLDVFFDIEGYPLDEGGLEYLWGNTYFDEHGERQFKDFWAHDREQEKQTFEVFIHWVYDRWQQDPSMHIYHYDSYEITACRKLMGRYGICEFEVDQLLRNEVFVDLYKVVKGCLLLGEPRYSIKNVEHLYRGKRETEVGTGSDSVVVYEHWRERNANGDEGDTWQTSQTLKDIRDYNIDDCDSTQELVDWLRKQQQSNHIEYLGKADVVEPEVKDEIAERTQLRDRLLELSQEQKGDDAAQAALTENLAWMLEFHRREAKPVFWKLFESLGLSHIELIDQLDCLACCERTEREAFKPTPKARNLAYEYSFDPTQEFKGARKSFYLLGEETADGKSAKVTYVEDASDLEHGLIVLQSKHEPPSVVSLVPDEYVNPNPIPQAITEIVAAYESDDLGRCAIIEFLNRNKPVISGHDGGAIVPSSDPAEKLQQIIMAAQRLDHSYLAIQGPPGAGKSYTGKHIIAELLKEGAKVGISSNSHKAINNLLLSTAEYCNEQGINASFACAKATEEALIEQGVSILKSNELANQVQAASVIGTTAWGFSRGDMAGQLDYLFVDEAGQVSVANLVAMSRSATNLILMGDQMQLGQPSQGTHPAESGLSVLDYLLHDNPTISDDMGVFLGTTYRMHSAVNEFVSEHIYEGKLGAYEGNDLRTVSVPVDYQGILNKEAGIIFVPVEHEGNTQASDEEVVTIQKLAKKLIGREFVNGSEVTRPIAWDDMLFIAPYNHQVSKLKAILGDEAKVGSVDKFQGQEAPIVFLSMCASDANDSPRGMEFLFDRHRINVAVSRAQCLVIVVASSVLGKTNASRVEQLRLINLFNALCAQ
ncbi:MAG: TM0106 family RecB-like putative nuclease, partial [Mariprofundaceae bacterium]